jgi:hypothetical protein
MLHHPQADLCAEVMLLTLGRRGFTWSAPVKGAEGHRGMSIGRVNDLIGIL